VPNVNPAFVFVHGAWHDAATWRLVTPLLQARGNVVRASDLPGAGRNARAPLASILMEIAGNAHWRVEACRKANA
jgi:pimeloyl-ACP methyl ester carboxylesterase